MSETLQNAIAVHLHQRTHDESEGCEFDDPCTDEDGWIGEAYINYVDVALCVLSTPELEAIRKALKGDPHDWCCEICWTNWALHYDLPDSVIKWVLGVQ